MSHFFPCLHLNANVKLAEEHEQHINQIIQEKDERNALRDIDQQNEGEHP